MRYARLTARTGGAGADAWEIHARAQARRAAGEKIILLSIGEDQGSGPIPAVADAAVAALRAGRHHYAPCEGLPALRAAVAEAHRARTGQPVGSDHCVVTAGAQNALFSTMACLLDPGDEVIVPEPYYVTYPATMTALGAEMRRVPCRPEDGFGLDPDAVAAAVGPRTRAVVVNSPNNPTGAVYSRDALEAVAETCRRHNLWLVSDEVYAAMAFDGPAVSPASLPGMAERCVTISSLSKSHRMAGWRLGWVVANPDLAKHLERLFLCMLYGLPPFIQDAALVALAEAGDDVAAQTAAYRGRRDLVCQRLERVPGLGVHQPAGGMFVMLDVRGTGLDAHTFASRLLDEFAVAVLPGDAFGPSARGHMRLGLVASSGVLADACERIAALVGRL